MEENDLFFADEEEELTEFERELEMMMVSFSNGNFGSDVIKEMPKPKLHNYAYRLLKWLREVHKIVVCISPMQEIDGDCIEWCAEIYKIVGEKGLSLEDEIYWDSYEEAQNEALKYTLENLI